MAVAILLIILALALSFFGTAGVVWLVCWAFGLAWSWEIAISVWAAICHVSSAAKSTICRWRLDSASSLASPHGVRDAA